MLIEIVSHCWAQQLPHFADALCYQLSSIILDHPKNCGVILSVCCCPDDKDVCGVVREYSKHCAVRAYRMPIEHLGRRCIGRNFAAKRSTADIVWFADVDHVFREGILDRLAEYEWPDDVVMVYPRKIKIHQDHATGDQATSLMRRSPSIMDIEPTEFIDKKYGKAIGGVQIVRGDFAREHGYLASSARWCRPRMDGKPFGDFRDDLVYRSFCSGHGKIVGIDLPGLYRIRHTRTTYQPDIV